MVVGSPPAQRGDPTVSRRRSDKRLDLPAAYRVERQDRDATDPGRWHGILRALLRWRARLSPGRRDMRRRAAGAQVVPDSEQQRRLAELHRMAERAEFRRDGLLHAGPVQSRPLWEAELGARDQEVDRAWRAYADALWGVTHEQIPPVCPGCRNAAAPRPWTVPTAPARESGLYMWEMP